MKYGIEGTISQYTEVTLSAGENLWISKGNLVSLDQGLEWQLKLPGGAEGAVKRVLAGESMAMVWVTARKEGCCRMASNEPGKITVWNLETDGPIVTTRGAFLGAWGDIDITVTTARRVGAMIFGGAGLFLQKISGKGLVFVHGAGDFVDLELAEGRSLQVSTGNLAAFAAHVDYDVRMVGGCLQKIFGGEGLFMTEMRGPGRVLLQSLKRSAAHRAKAAVQSMG